VNLIKLKVEGLDAEQGHVPVDEFLEKLTHLVTALNEIDRLVGQSGSPKLYYRIVNATHGSPLEVTLEPVLKKKTVAAGEQYIHECHDRFFRELSAIKRMEPLSPDVETGLLENLYDLAIGAGTEFKSAALSNDKAHIELDKTFETNLARLVREEDVSYGGMDGKLEAVNIHGGNRRCWIYPQLGPQRVRCDFLPGTSEQIREALGHLVHVEGAKFFRPPGPFPIRIAVKEFEILDGEEAVSLSSLRGIAPNATEGVSAVEFIRRIRNEWE